MVTFLKQMGTSHYRNDILNLWLDTPSSWSTQVSARYMSGPGALGGLTLRCQPQRLRFAGPSWFVGACVGVPLLKHCPFKMCIKVIELSRTWCALPLTLPGFTFKEVIPGHICWVSIYDSIFGQNHSFIFLSAFWRLWKNFLYDVGLPVINTTNLSLSRLYTCLILGLCFGRDVRGMDVFDRSETALESLEPGNGFKIGTWPPM